jgi:hypothetical protein
MRSAEPLPRWSEALASSLVAALAVKRYCQKHNVPLQIVVKATETQVKAALRSMFPEATQYSDPD